IPHYPSILFLVAAPTLWLAAQLGVWLGKRHPLDDEVRQDFALLQGASLTLLGLIIAFSFSMAAGRYDQRKNLEEAEANAIGTEILRADFLPIADAATVRKLLGEYLDQRILFYLNKDDNRRIQNDRRTSVLQADLWS